MVTMGASMRNKVTTKVQVENIIYNIDRRMMKQTHNITHNECNTEDTAFLQFTLFTFNGVTT